MNEYFNSVTIKGRANVAKATLGAVGGIYLWYRMTSGSKVAYCQVMLRHDLIIRGM